MIKEVRMTLSFNDTEGETNLLGRFSEEDLELLGDFCTHAEELHQSKVIQEGFPQSVKFHWTKDKGVQIEAEPFEDEFISSFLHKLRPIFLSEEPASFDKTSGLIGRAFSDKAMKRHLKAIRYRFETSSFSAYGQVSVGNVPVFDQATIKIWLNAFEYHQDPEKREFLKYIENQFGRKGARIVFIQQLAERFEGIYLLQDLARYIIDL
ncbi:MAG TPA: hypothetical protein PKC89_02510 [Pyrinomonadaceae bacterium]|nr:hypothetical protein [Pyrinomonadaceae bacterium]